jgi:hypothetical protein
MVWQEWDVNWYLIISRQGYFAPQTTAFFPLYPMSIGAVSWLLGDGSSPLYPSPDRVRLLVGMALSNLALLAALFGIARLALFERPFDREIGPRTVLITLGFPIAIAWTVAYAESYFLALAVFTLLFARKGRWNAATGTALLLGLARPVAIILVLPLLWEYGQQHGWWRWPIRLGLSDLPGVGRGFLVAIAAPLGTALYLGYCQWRYGDFLLPLHVEGTGWLHVTRPQWWTLEEAIRRLVHEGSNTNMLGLELALIVLVALVTVVSVRKVPLAYTLYLGGLLFVATISPVPSQRDLLWGTGRYLAGAFPVFLILGAWGARRPWLAPGIACVGFLVQGALAIAWFQGQPVM